MPAIYLGGSGWSLARQWPERHSELQWQHQLEILLRSHVLIREMYIRRPGADIENILVNWSHSGIGKISVPVWERLARKSAGTATSTFDIGNFTVSFASSGASRRGTVSTSNAAQVSGPDMAQDMTAQVDVVLESPLRVSAENAALICAVCSAVGLIAATLNPLSPSAVGEESARVGARLFTSGARQGHIDSAERAHSRAKSTGVPLGHVLNALEPFHAKVLELICVGWTNAEIAEATRMSVGSVRAATSLIYARLGVRNRHEAAAVATELMHLARSF